MNFLQTSYDEHEKIWSSPKTGLYYDFDTSVGKVIFTNLKNYPKNICQISDIDGKSVTNQEALTYAVRIALHLKKMGLGREEVVGIAARNTTYLLPVGVGCFFNCTPFHAINPILDGKTTKHLFDITKPKIIYCDGQDYEKIRTATKALKPLIYTLNDHIEGVPKVEDLIFEKTPMEMYYRPESLVLGGGQTVAILCSSGTTGLPKAVCISNHSLLYENSSLTSEDVIYSSSGLDWMTGIMFLITSTTLSCTRIITNKPYTPEYYVELVKKYKVSYSVVAPRHVATLLTCPTATSENLASLRFVFIGGGCISPTSMQNTRELLKNANVTFGYGLTEVGGISLNFSSEYLNSVGKLLPNLRMRIVDDNGQCLGPNVVGEIQVHNGYNWNGYFNNPIETQGMQDYQGWFHTGDLGYFNEKSFLYVVDRKKDTLKYQGMQYWPTEIEEVIAELPEVADVCVVGIYDERNGDAAAALVVRTKDGGSLSEADIKAYVAKRLNVPYKQLHAGVQFVDKLPQNENGKTNKVDAKALFLA